MRFMSHHRFAERPNALAHDTHCVPNRRSPIRKTIHRLTPFASLWLFSILSFIYFPALTLAQSFPIVTNVDQFWNVPNEYFLRGCSFHITGVVTLADTNRNLMVVQDSTGAVAISGSVKKSPVMIGQRVLVEGNEAAPAVEGFPDYPFHPSGSDVPAAFEAPSNWGNYHLTRMRGYLHPPVTGNYTFWIASDNSSELWLSTDEDPAKVRKIAFISEGFWVNPREWSRYPSQRSETIFLRSDKTYYVEAFQEQVLQDDHLSVAWQGPDFAQALVDGKYLTPFADSADEKKLPVSHGILREFWTNYSAGSLVGITGPRRYASVLSAKEIHLTILGNGPLPEPRRISLDQPLAPENNYCWVQVEGMLSFLAVHDTSASLEMLDNNEQTELHVQHWDKDSPLHPLNVRAEAQGVCEGTHSMTGPLTPGLIWVPSQSNIRLLETTITNTAPLTLAQPAVKTQMNPTGDMAGFYITRGVVTFNDDVLKKHCTFIQDDNGSSIFILDPAERLVGKLQIGEWVQIGGTLLLGKDAPGLQPTVLRNLGLQTMPKPIIGPTDLSLEKIANGIWTEVEGVVRSVDTNGVILLAGKKALASVWIGRTPPEVLRHYVDATLRIQGVMSTAVFGRPVLLTPSREFVEVEEAAPEHPFDLPVFSMANPKPVGVGFNWQHRVRMGGVVTFRGDWGLFVQTASGSMRVQTVNAPAVSVGDGVEIVGFPDENNSVTGALVRPTGNHPLFKPLNLDLATVSPGERGSLFVKVRADLLSQKKNANHQMLELEQGQRAFEAVLATHDGQLPELNPGSRIEITGVCDFQPIATAAARGGLSENATGLWRVWLRSPADVVVLSGPPWWTWKRASILIGIMTAILSGTILWIQLLRVRLRRQQAARLTFSRQTLQGQESERRRIAANLHDSLGQNLLVIKNQLHLAMQPVGAVPELQRRLEEISSMASQAIEEVRQITHDLRPYQLDRLGLTQTIRAAIRRVSENTAISFASDVEDIDGLLDKESEIHVYRIVQESLNNVVKHSKATEVTIIVKKNLARISLGIRDNGQGFNANAFSAHGVESAGFGLSNISERARILGGELVVDSRPGSGVSLTIEIPILNSKHEAPGEIIDR